jgi:hypothetical protein
MVGKLRYLAECTFVYLLVQITFLNFGQGAYEIRAVDFTMLCLQGIALAIVFTKMPQEGLGGGMLFGLYAGVIAWTSRSMFREPLGTDVLWVDAVVSLVTFLCVGGIFGLQWKRFQYREGLKGCFPVRLSVWNGMIGVGALFSEPERWFPPSGAVDACRYLRSLSSWGWTGAEIILDFKQGQGITELELSAFGNDLIRECLGTGDGVVGVG